MPQPAISDCSITSTTLEANHILHITAADNQNRTQTASIDLDSIIGNVNGALSLGATGFSAQARNVALADNGTVLDADLPDANGDYSTSSCSIQQEINTLDGQLSLCFALGLPHSTVHVNANSVDEADQALTSQVTTVGSSPPVDKMMTLQVDPSCGVDNTNAQWVAQNLGPHGTFGAVMTLSKDAFCVVGGTVQAAQQGACVIL
ncbi:hypothetical protein MMC34_003796 [Xylographa carneopallida]|nr:hypothetical protein [Xylographa carneopallida]